jgi:hypothetical protein
MHQYEMPMGQIHMLLSILVLKRMLLNCMQQKNNETRRNKPISLGVDLIWSLMATNFVHCAVSMCVMEHCK